LKGKVIKIEREMITVLIENDRTSFIELLGDEVDLGDILSGNLEDLGGETLFNITQNEEIEVFIQDLD
jgi:hypothetical protein